jgi:hypothetical protein
LERETKELTSQISLEIVKNVAPEELDLFDDYKEAFFQNPKVFEENEFAKKEKPLGFAFPAGTTEMLTSTILPLVLGAIKNYVKKKSEGKFAKDDVRKIRDDTYNALLTNGVSKKKAELIADSLAGKMLLMQ